MAAAILKPPDRSGGLSKKKKKELWQLRGWERQTGDGVKYNRTCWRRRRRRKKKKSKRGDVSK